MPARLFLFLFATSVLSAQTQLTIYNENFGVVKERRQFALAEGENEVRVTDVAAWIEPDSVIVRDVDDPDAIRVLEQNYEADPLDQGRLLEDAKGQIVEFEAPGETPGDVRIVRARVLRSGYVPLTGVGNFGAAHRNRIRNSYRGRNLKEPIVEVDGKIRFGLPGKPRFPSLAADAVLEPTLLWRLHSDETGERQLQFSYLTGGIRWEAAYNAVASGAGDRFDLIGWVTLENVSGKTFTDARVKLVAGDVARALPVAGQPRSQFRMAPSEKDMAPRDAVVSRGLDDYHLYEPVRPITVRHGETKQIELLRAADVSGRRLYVYDGIQIEPRHRLWTSADLRRQGEYGRLSNPKVWTMLEFENSVESGLGMPLPAGTVRFYRRDADGRNEFVGEDAIDHTPADETLRLYTGNAFDLVGERKQTAFDHNRNERRTDEDFEIRIRNHKDVEVEVRVVERLYRWANWEIQSNSHDFAKTDSRTVEFRPRVPPGEEVVITYRAHYFW